MVNALAAFSGLRPMSGGAGNRELAFSPDSVFSGAGGTGNMASFGNFFNMNGASLDGPSLFSMMFQQFMALFGGGMPSFFGEMGVGETAQGQATSFLRFSPPAGQGGGKSVVQTNGGGSNPVAGSIHRGQQNAQGYVALSNGMPMTVPAGSEGLHNEVTAMYEGLPTDPSLYNAASNVTNVRILNTGITMNNQCYDRRMWMALYQAGVPIDQAQRQGYLAAVNGPDALHANFIRKGANAGDWDISRPGNVYQLAEETLDDGTKQMVIYHWVNELPPGITREDVRNASFGDSPYPEYKGLQDRDYYHPLLITPGQDHQQPEVQENWRAREAIDVAAGYSEHPSTAGLTEGAPGGNNENTEGAQEGNDQPAEASSGDQPRETRPA